MPSGVYKRKPTSERFWAKVDKNGPLWNGTPCWLWTGATAKGYGNVFFQSKHRRAHRVSYEWMKGPIPKGLELDHLCRTPLCVNYDHLEAVTHQENQRRGFGWAGRQGAAGIRAKQTHCLHGHEFTKANTYIAPSDTKRACRTCRSNRWPLQRSG